MPEPDGRVRAATISGRARAWAMAAGDIDQSDATSYDINGGDKSIWQMNNGQFADYLQADLDFNGDVNGGDKAIWNDNFGRFSAVPK